MAEVVVELGASKISATDTLLSVEKSGSDKRQWKRMRITELFSRKPNSFLPFAELCVRTGEQVDVVARGKEGQILAAMETVAAVLYCRLVEHTGRSVEIDEHGMNVSEQLAKFSSRWPRHERLPSMEVEIRTLSSGGFDIQLPSRITPVMLGSYLASLAGIFVLALIPTLGTLGTLNPLYTMIPLLIITNVLWYFASNEWHVLENNHIVTISKDTIEVTGRFLNLFPARPTEYPLSEFKDLDVTNKGRLAFLFSDRRLICDVNRHEGRWVIGEIAHRMMGSDSSEDEHISGSAQGMEDEVSDNKELVEGLEFEENQEEDDGKNDLKESEEKDGFEASESINDDDLQHEATSNNLPSATELGRMKKAQLVSLAENRNLNSEGTKAEIIARLLK